MSDHIAIIGGGLSGLTLALALHQQAIKCTIYEAYEAPLDTGGGLMLTPNGNKALVGVGILDSLLDDAFAFDSMYVQLGTTGTILEAIETVNIEKFGVRSYRAYRFTVLERLLAKVHHIGIPIEFNRRFSHVVSETDESVTWQFTDGSTSSASILIGADGIHSTWLYHFGSRRADRSTWTFRTRLVNLNDKKNKHAFPSVIVVPQLGGVSLSPQNKSGDDTMISVMRSFPRELDRWGDLNSDKKRLRDMFRENVDKFPEIVQKAVADIPAEQLVVWPGYVIPSMERWISAQGRVVLVGDSAHALPPSSGQGVNQVFEDAYLLAGVLGRSPNFRVDPLQKALQGWQSYRQERVDVVLSLNKLMELRRLPAAAKAQQGITDDASTSLERVQEYSDKLFTIDYERAVDHCLEGVTID